jgi:hypothetical protein
MRFPSIISVGGLLAILLIVAGAVRAADVQIKEGTVVSATANTLVIVDAESKQLSYQVDATVPVQVNGKPGKLEDLKKSTPVKVTIDKQGKVMSVATVDTHKAAAR